MPNQLYELFAGGSSKENAAAALLALMLGLSQDGWCAVLMSDLEYLLWPPEAGMRFGQETMSERQAVLLRLLAEEAGGWWVFDTNGPRFLPTEEWIAHYNAKPEEAL